ncbi:hypothetical protein BDW02DRAFT_302514 [Decorospora gaudefroyi]|uniref:Uncharacterized protein n=1 Tax=Decorospora gaudefroyi TaxID=184978 RepID=A0A6A5KHA8_9PLEO|nr:hypothetical protein BDW02DRAFT_302514 [Decorospora gaudefroyi]
MILSPLPIRPAQCPRVYCSVARASQEAAIVKERSYVLSHPNECKGAHWSESISVRSYRLDVTMICLSPRYTRTWKPRDTAMKGIESGHLKDGPKGSPSLQTYSFCACSVIELLYAVLIVMARSQVPVSTVCRPDSLPARPSVRTCGFRGGRWDKWFRDGKCKILGMSGCC